MEDSADVRFIRGLFDGDGRGPAGHDGGSVLGPGVLVASGPPLFAVNESFKLLFRDVLRAVSDFSPLAGYFLGLAFKNGYFLESDYFGEKAVPDYQKRTLSRVTLS